MIAKPRTTNLTSMRQKKEFIPALGTMRAIAAFLVIYGHYSVWVSPFQNEAKGIVQFRIASSTGMTLFFVLSGFVIHYNYARLFSGSSRAGAAFSLAIARIARLYPLYLFFLFAWLVRSHGHLQRFVSDESFRAFVLLHIVGIQAWFPIAYENAIVSNSFFNVSWSISTELFFYLVYPLIFRALSVLRSQRSTISAAAVLCAIMAFGSPATATFLVERWSPLGPSLGFGTTDPGNSFWMWLIYLSPYFRLPEFLLGALMAHLHAQRRATPAHAPSRAEYALPWVALAVILASGSLVFVFPHVPQIAMLEKNFLLAPGLGLLMLSVAGTDTPVSRLLGAGALVWLGEISYSLYLIHPFVPRLIDIPYNAYPMGVVGLVMYAVLLGLSLVFLIAMSWGTYTLIERPGRRIIRRIGGRLLRDPSVQADS